MQYETDRGIIGTRRPIGCAVMSVEEPVAAPPPAPVGEALSADGVDDAMEDEVSVVDAALFTTTHKKAHVHGRPN